MTEYIDLRKLNREELFRLRKSVVRLKKKGCAGKEIERILHVRSNRVSEIWRKYLKSGAKGLKPGRAGRRPGEKTLLSLTEEQAIKQIMIEKTPDELMMPFSLWTFQIASDYIKREYDVRLPMRSMTNYFKRWGFICKAPMNRAEYRQDEAFTRFIEEEFPAIVRRAKSENVGIYWFCEARVSGNISIAGAVTARGTARFLFFNGGISQKKFILLMKRLITYADRKVFFVAANKKAFRGENVRAWLKNKENRIEVFYHPTI